jgi:hypothetical protein
MTPMSNVRNFGASGDGVDDDTEAIQHAIDVAGGEIEFPRGNYKISKPLRIDLAKTGRCCLNGQGGTAKLIMSGEGPAIDLLAGHTKSADPNDFQPSVWKDQRMPMISAIEIEGDHPLADGIRIEGVMQPTITGVLIRKVRHGIHVVKRSRNVLVSNCHIYYNTGIGIFLDHCNLHQTIISDNHISYCRLGGVRIQGGEIRNLQITGNDIEYNNNRAHKVPDADSEPTAEIYIDVEDGSVREGTIASNTLQATYSPAGANIRFIGSGSKGNQRTGMWAISGNLIGSQETNIHLTSGLGFAITGNYIYSGHKKNIFIEDSKNITLGSNTLGHNPDYGDKELTTGIRLVDCQDCTISGMILQDALAGQNTVDQAIVNRKDALLELVRCRRLSVVGCQILEGTPAGVLIEDCSDALLSSTMIIDERATKLMRQAIVWRPGASGNWTGKRLSIQGCHLPPGTEIPLGVHQVNNIYD